jgi:hypothetical protein
MIITILYAILSGILGRMGGAGKSGQWYDRFLDTKWRDIGCPLVFIANHVHLFGYNPGLWWAYILVFGAMWAAFSTYWDKVFGYDNMLFSGIVAAFVALPLAMVEPGFLLIYLIRIPAMGAVWWALNTHLPERVFIWRRDVVEEFSRYFCSV